MFMRRCRLRDVEARSRKSGERRVRWLRAALAAARKGLSGNAIAGASLTDLETGSVMMWLTLSGWIVSW